MALCIDTACLLQCTVNYDLCVWKCRGEKDNDTEMNKTPRLTQSVNAAGAPIGLRLMMNVTITTMRVTCIVVGSV